MATAGPNASGTQASTDRGALNPAWSAPNNAVSSNNADTTVILTSPSGTPSDYLDLSNFGFSLPSGATVNGVTVSIERARSIGACQDDTVQLIKGGTASGNNKAATSTDWPTSDAAAAYGGVSDLWGLTLTDTDVNASNFGVRIAAKAATTAQAEIDFVSISIDYTAAAGGTTRLLGLLGVGT